MRRFGILRRISRALNRRLLGFLKASGPRSFIALETRGRKTGRVHRVVLPVYLVNPHRMFVVSSYGRRSDWLRNVLVSPNIRLTRAGQTHRGSVRAITLQEFHRGMGDSTKEATSTYRRLAPLVRTAFLVRARISGTVVEITT